MKINLDSPAQEVRIEIIPLIDVVFCILIFFILAALGLTRQAAINVDLPRATTGTTQNREMLIVSIDPIGQTYIEQQPVTQDQLFQVLLNYQQTNPGGLMVLYASRSASYNDVVQVLDLLRSVGGDRVALATLPDSGQPQLETPSPVPGLDGQLAPTNPFGDSDSTNPFNPNQELFPGYESLPSPSANPSGSTEPSISPAP